MRSLRVTGTLESLSAVGTYVSGATAKAGLDEHAAYGLRLAVDEIATNAIVHGYQKAGQSGYLTVTALLTEEKLTILLEENSPPYDPRQTPPPHNLDQAPEDRPSGGLGVFLAMQGVDAYKYDYVDGTNRHTFVVNRTS